MKNRQVKTCRFFGGATQIRTGDKGVADPGLTTWRWHHLYKKDAKLNFCVLLFWSGLRGSNSLPQPWQGCALPDELNPHIKNMKQITENQRRHILWCLRSESNQRHEDFQSSALPTELQRRNWRLGRDSNPRPLA